MPRSAGRATGKDRNAQARRRMTPRQVEILRMIRDHQRIHGYSPTMQGMADVIGISKVTVFEHVTALVDKGMLRRLPHKARSLELTGKVDLPDEASDRAFPIVGHIAAGNPIVGGDERDTLNLDDMFESRYGTFVLKVRGDSMIDEQICDGDYVICEKRSQPRQGETVVALLDDGEATLKKYFREKGRVRLQPANDNFEPIFTNSVTIQGIVMGVLRSYGA